MTLGRAGPGLAYAESRPHLAIRPASASRVSYAVRYRQCHRRVGRPCPVRSLAGVPPAGDHGSLGRGVRAYRRSPRRAADADELSSRRARTVRPRAVMARRPSDPLRRPVRHHARPASLSHRGLLRRPPGNLAGTCAMSANARGTPTDPRQASIPTKCNDESRRTRVGSPRSRGGAHPTGWRKVGPECPLRIVDPVTAAGD